jgi:hypothetical protein
MVIWLGAERARFAYVSLLIVILRENQAPHNPTASINSDAVSGTTVTWFRMIATVRGLMKEPTKGFSRPNGTSVVKTNPLPLRTAPPSSKGMLSPNYRWQTISYLCLRTAMCEPDYRRNTHSDVQPNLFFFATYSKLV